MTSYLTVKIHYYLQNKTHPVFAVNQSFFTKMCRNTCHNGLFPSKCGIDTSNAITDIDVL